MPDESSRYGNLFAVQDARRAVRLALVRVLTFDQLLERYSAILTDESPSEVIFAIGERALDLAMAEKLAAAIRKQMEAAAQATSKDRNQIDRYVALLVPHLPEQLAIPLLSEYLEDKRKTRRDVGFRALKRCDVTPALAGYLKERFFGTGDTKFLKFALRGKISISPSEAREMVIAFKAEGDDYWGMRIIGSQLEEAATQSELARAHPKEFIWACGRSGVPEMADAVRETFAAANDKIPLLGITVWAFGKLNALDDLRRMDSLLAELESEFNY
jgi:hypothetical protein